MTLLNSTKIMPFTVNTTPCIFNKLASHCVVRNSVLNRVATFILHFFYFWHKYIKKKTCYKEYIFFLNSVIEMLNVQLQYSYCGPLNCTVHIYCIMYMFISVYTIIHTVNHYPVPTLNCRTYDLYRH